MDEPCLRCMLYASKGRHTDVLREYLASIPEQEWTASAIYGERLAICRRCKDHRSGMCAHCPDYVEIRCARKNASCPASQPNWR